MIEIDGRAGGGQMVRTAIGLSAYTGKGFRITNIRNERKDPGLKEQHLQAVNAVAGLCSADVKGNKMHSTELAFMPGSVSSKNINVKISTAGSVGLVLQALMIPALMHDITIKIDGGADFGKWAPPTPYLQNVLIPLLEKMGYRCKLETKKYGFFPKGGSLLEFSSSRSRLGPINIVEKKEIVSINGLSVASNSLKKANVAERQADSARNLLSRKFGIGARISSVCADSLCPGSGVQLWITTKNSVIGANSLGEIGKKSEQVGGEAANNLIFEHENGCIDQHTADQMIPYMAIAGKSSIMASRITEHTRTNIEIVKRFLDVNFKIEDNIISCD